MADTIDNVKLYGIEYQDLNLATGIPVGSKIEIQNQSSDVVKISIGVTQPLVTTDKFYLLKDDLSTIATISAGENNVWVFGNGNVHVEVV